MNVQFLRHYSGSLAYFWLNILLASQFANICNVFFSGPLTGFLEIVHCVVSTCLQMNLAPVLLRIFHGHPNLLTQSLNSHVIFCRNFTRDIQLLPNKLLSCKTGNIAHRVIVCIKLKILHRIFKGM